MSHFSKESRWILGLVSAAFFMENLDGTVIATALPEMAKSFHVSPVQLNVGMTAYMLTLAIFVPCSGWLADRMGARTIFSTAVAIFTFASALCGFSNGLWEFTGLRVLQGLGGAMMVPVGRLVVLRSTEKVHLVRAINYITWPGLVAPVIGPPIGGFITTYSTWRWIFYLNVPLGLIAFVLALRLLQNDPERIERKFDWIGFSLIGFACAACMYALEISAREEPKWPLIGIIFGIGLFSGMLGIFRSHRIDYPVIDLSLLRLRSFAVSVTGGSIFRISISVTPFLLPLMFQVGFGMDPFHSGLLILAVFAGNLGMKTLVQSVLRQNGFRRTLIGNGVINSFFLFICGFFTHSTPVVVMAAILFVSGLSRSLQFTALNALAYADVPKEKMTSATTFASTVQQFMMGTGVAVGALALRVSATFHGHSQHTLDEADFRYAFFLVGAFCLLAVGDSLLLRTTDGIAVSNYKPRTKVSPSTTVAGS